MIASQEPHREHQQKLLDLQLSEDEWLQLKTLLSLLTVRFCRIMLAETN